MWWQAVFWILLIPLIIVEVIIFLRSRKFYWLIYALSIFTYIIAVSYTIDVFALGRNTIIILLLASALLMFAIGRQLGKKVKRQKALPRKELIAVSALAAVMVIVFVVSAIFGRLEETITPVASIKESGIVRTCPLSGKCEPRIAEVAVLERKLTNRFILPVPVRQVQYTGCLVTAQGTFNIEPMHNQVENQEVRAGETKTIKVTVQPYMLGEDQGLDASELRLYGQGSQYYSYASCDAMDRQPDYTIPIE